MAISTNVRPRSASERMVMAKVLERAPRVVGLTFEDDGWVAAQLAISGRVPVWCGDGDSTSAESLLARLGLPPLGQEAPNGHLEENLTLISCAPSDQGSLASVDGPLVTILICTYNRASLLPAAVASARRQNWPVEIIVVDDGSTDGTREWLASQPDLRVIYMEQNGGKSAALNAGISQARGEALMILDDDDQILPGAVQVLARQLFASPDRVLVFGDAIKNRQGSYIDWIPATRLPGTCATQVTLLQIPGLTGAHVTRMDAQRAAGLFDTRLEQGEDMDMFLRLSRQGSFATVPFATFLCGCHSGERGSSENRHIKVSEESENRLAMPFITPVFRERWVRYRRDSSRNEGFAWALGLQQRNLSAEALVELGRWPGPFTLSEAWIREQCGVPTAADGFPSALLIADDGDPGALEDMLNRQSRCANLWVNLEVPRDPLGAVRLYWEGDYGAREVFRRWVRHEGPYTLRITSAPDWSPPPIPMLSWLPDVGGVDAILALAAVLDWPPPVQSRRGLQKSMDPLVSACRQVREALANGTHDHVGGLLEGMNPSWVGTWLFRAALYERLGDGPALQRAMSRAIELGGSNVPHPVDLLVS